MKSEITSENDYIINQWETHFDNMRNRKLAIYGIGKNTKIILDNFLSDNIVGLMDEVRTGESIYGKPIISIDEALALGIDAIVIVARTGNVRIIYRRIADVCAANSIDVFDISGKVVGIDFFEEKSFEKYAEITEKILKGKIDKADVVSFDIFDTLLMRRVLYPRDIFVLAGRRIGADFDKQRVNVEMELYREGKHPSIYDIYHRINGASPAIEIELESQFLIRRESIAAMLQYAREEGKSVYLVSDMYLPKEVIKNLFDGLGIYVEEENILVSCDYGVSKSSGLFDVLRSKVGAKRILHIGDNLEADIESAKRYGIDDTFRVESALSMLEDSYASEILKYDNTLPNRLLIGEFVGKQLNNPFLFSKSRGRFILNDTYEMAYSLIAPLIYCFFGWMTKKACDLRLERILLSSRDGFVIEKIYELIQSKGVDLPPMEYFYSSRFVSVLAGAIDDEDILHAVRLAYAGKTEELLKQRFHLTDNEILARGDLEDENYILLHKDVIMRHAETARKQYKTYIDKLDIPCGANVGFFDFVSSGTCQKALDNFVDFKLVGLYFIAMNSETEYKSDVKINTMFGTLNVFANVYERYYNILENYFFLENIVTSYEPTLSGFDDYGNPVFIAERRTEKQLQTLRQIHGAILDYVNDSKIELGIIGEVDPAVPDFLLNLLQPQFSLIDTDYFDNEEIEDEFCNRTFSLSDTIKSKSKNQLRRYGSTLN